MRSKFIRGKPIYSYRGKLYMEQPEKTVITKIVYDEINNSSKVYCRKPTVFIELISLIIIVLCIIINIKTGWGTDVVSIRYNSSAVYYNGRLYLNLTVDKAPSSVKCTVIKGDDILYDTLLNSGDIVTSIELPYSLKYKLIISSKNILGNELSETYDITSSLRE